MNQNWSMSLIVPHRPLSSGGLTTPPGPLIQETDGRWRIPSGVVMEDIREDIYRAISFINKNSAFHHTILVAIDHDVFPQANWLAEFPNVRIVKSTFVPPENVPNPPYCRLAAAYRDAIETVPDMDWICYGFTSDLIVCARWDQYIWNAANKYGEDHVYVPMFIEMKGSAGSHMDYEITGLTPTPHQIWVEFREKICCHGLTWPQITKGYITEDDFNDYLAIMRRGREELGLPDVVFEPCGNRSVGYYNVLCMRAKYAKIAGFDVNKGMGFDIAFDDALRDKARRMKGVVVESGVYHPQGETFHTPFRWGQEV